MNTIMSVFLEVPTALPPGKIPFEMNSASWFVAGAIVAILLLFYLFLALVKPEKF